MHGKTAGIPSRRKECNILVDIFNASLTKDHTIGQKYNVGEELQVMVKRYKCCSWMKTLGNGLQPVYVDGKESSSSTICVSSLRDTTQILLFYLRIISANLILFMHKRVFCPRIKGSRRQ